MREMEALLDTLTVKELITVLRQFKGGPLGYDFSKKDKAFLYEDAVAEGRAYARRRYSGQGAGPVIDDVHKWIGDDRGTQGEGKHDGRGDSGGSEGRGGGGQEDEQSVSDMLKEALKGSDGKGRKGDGKSKGGRNPIERIVDKAIEDGQREGKIPKGSEVLTRQEAQDEYIKRSEAKQIISEEVSEQVEEQSRVFRLKIEAPEKTYEVGKEPRHKVFEEVLTAVGAGLNVLLVGPAGCGKTHMAEQVAKALDLQFRFTGAVASEYKLLGFTDAQGRVVSTEYRRAYETGGVFLWDEMDASSPAALLAFNAGLANGWQDFPDKVIPCHANFRAIAAANTYGHGADRMYVGRNQLDAASLDRFYVVNMDYDEALEKTLYGDGAWVQYVWRARKVVKDISLRHVVSMRAIDSGLKLIAAGRTRSQFETGVLWKGVDKSDLEKVREMMRKQGNIPGLD